MLPKYMVIVTIVAFAFIEDGLTQSFENDTSFDRNDTEASSGDEENETTVGNSDVIYTSKPATTISTTKTTASMPETSTVTKPKTTITTVPSTTEVEEKDCFSLMRPSVFALLVLALCCICLLFVYTVICSCLLAKRRIGDVESVTTTKPRTCKREEKETTKQKEATEKKKAADKKKKAEKKKQTKTAKEKVKKENTKKKEKTEKKETSKEKTNKPEKGSSSIEQSIAMKETGTVESKTTATPVLDSGKSTLETVQEHIATPEDKNADKQTSEPAGTSEIRISNIPPPPLDDVNDPPPVAQTEVIIEALPPPPPPEDIEGKEQSEAISDHETQSDKSNTTSDAISSSVAAIETKDEIVKEPEDQADDLANVGMKLDEVLDMLHSIQE